MSDLIFYRVPKTTICPRTPLTAMVQLRPQSAAASVTLELESLSPDGRYVAARWNLDQGGPGRYTLDIPGDAILPGAYAMLLGTDREVYEFDEILAVISNDEYEKMVREQADEPFIEPGMIPADAVPRFVQRLADNSLAPDRFDVDLGRPPVGKLDVVSRTSRSFEDARIRWAVDNVVNAFRYVACPGIVDDRWEIVMDDTELGIYAIGKLQSPALNQRQRVLDAAWLDLIAMGVPHGDLPPGVVYWGEYGDDRFEVKVSLMDEREFIVSVNCRM